MIQAMLQQLSEAWDNSYKALVGAAVALTVAGGSIGAIHEVQQYRYNHHVSQGTVIGKEYDDPDTWVTTSCSGKPLHCTTMVHHDGEHWRLRIAGTDRVGEHRKVWHEVDHETFDHAEKGRQFDLDHDRWL
jgi:hypothetical protein